MSDHCLTILQLNDLHGYQEPHPEVFRGACGFHYRTCGGLARIARVFRQVRDERPGAVLALDIGDTFHGTCGAVQSRQRGGGLRRGRCAARRATESAG